MSNYRIVVAYSEEKKAFVAKAPELGECEADGETRGEAIAKLEEEMTAQIENIKGQGLEPPDPIDLQPFDGKINLTVSPELHRDLAFMAEVSKVPIEELVVELLTRGVGGRPIFRGGGGRPREGGRRSREGQGQRYHDIMENREDFIDYVRRMEQGNKGRGGGRGGRGRSR